jgi:hypothetical protein
MALVPPDVVTVTLTVLVPAGETAVQEVDDEQDTLVPALPPKLTVVELRPPGGTKPVPVMVTVVPPPTGPPLGLTPVTVGAAPSKGRRGTAEAGDASAMAPPTVITSAASAVDQMRPALTSPFRDFLFTCPTPR